MSKSSKLKQLNGAQRPKKHVERKLDGEQKMRKDSGKRGQLLGVLGEQEDGGEVWEEVECKVVDMAVADMSPVVGVVWGGEHRRHLVGVGVGLGGALVEVELVE
jgi:hypothetical protein